MLALRLHANAAQAINSPNFQNLSHACEPNAVYGLAHLGPQPPDNDGEHPERFQIQPVLFAPNSRPDCEYPKTRQFVRNFAFQEFFYLRSYCRRSLLFISRALKIKLIISCPLVGNKVYALQIQTFTQPYLPF